MNSLTPLDFKELVFSEYSVSEITNNPKNKIDYLNKLVNEGNIIVFKNELDKHTPTQLIKYFKNILLNNLETMVPIQEKCPNYVRFSHSDERAEVPIFCDSVSFFPWNRDLCDLFPSYFKFYQLKNLFSGAPINRYLRTSENGATARIAAHHYPEGKGFLGCHTDPIGSHQEITCTVLLDSGINDQCKLGGYYVIKNKEKVFFEINLNPGDFYIGHPLIPHGIEAQGKLSSFNPLSSLLNFLEVCQIKYQQI